MAPTDQGGELLRCLPDQIFVSHQYGRSEDLVPLRRKLPSHIRLIEFPPIEVTPEQRVSDDVIPAVLACPALIYVTSHFDSSFWVEFEREVALRNRRPVFEFDLQTERIERCEAEPRNIRATAIFCSDDRAYVAAVIDWLRKERSFEIDMGVDEARIAQTLHAPAINWTSEVAVYAFFLSRTALADRGVMKALRMLLAVPWQVLIICLDDLGARDILKSLQALHPGTENEREAGRRILESFRPIMIPDHRNAGDQVNWNDADNLMVRIFYQSNPARLMTVWRMYREEAEYMRGVVLDGP